LAVSTLGKKSLLDATRRRANNLNMTIVEITGGMLRAAHAGSAFCSKG
jgi:hypothetical protein